MAVLLVQTEMEPLEAEDAVTAVTIPSPLTIAVRQKALQIHPSKKYTIHEKVEWQ